MGKGCSSDLVEETVVNIKLGLNGLDQHRPVRPSIPLPG